MASADDFHVRDVSEFRFKQLTKIRVHESPTCPSVQRSNLLALSNIYGLIFVGYERGVKVVPTNEVYRINAAHKFNETFEGEVTFAADVATPSPPSDVALSCDDLVLSVAVIKDGAQFLYLYDVRALLNGQSDSFAQLRLSDAVSGHKLSALRWNPTAAPMLAYCLTDGSLTLASLNETTGFSVLGRVPGASAVSLCWSPKGKQLLVGRSDGKLTQFDHTAKEKACHDGPDYFTQPMKVCDVLWISSHVFVSAYTVDDPTFQPVIVVTTTAKHARPIHVNYDDICFGSDEQKSSQYYMTQVQEWDLTVCISNKAQDVALLGKAEESKDVWELWGLDDSSRAELPLDNDERDTYAAGLAVDMTAQTPIDLGDNRQHAASPVLVLLSSDGLLCPYHMMYTGKEFVTTAPRAVPNGSRLSLGLVTVGGVTSTSTVTAMQAAVPSSKPVAATTPVTPSTGAVAATTPLTPSTGAVAATTPLTSAAGAVAATTPATPSTGAVAAPGLTLGSPAKQPSFTPFSFGVSNQGSITPAQTIIGQKPAGQAIFGQQPVAPATLEQKPPAQATTFGQLAASQPIFGLQPSGQPVFGQQPVAPLTFAFNKSAAQPIFEQKPSADKAAGQSLVSQSSFGQPSAGQLPAVSTTFTFGSKPPATTAATVTTTATSQTTAAFSFGTSSLGAYSFGGSTNTSGFSFGTATTGTSGNNRTDSASGLGALNKNSSEGLSESAALASDVSKPTSVFSFGGDSSTLGSFLSDKKSPGQPSKVPVLPPPVITTKPILSPSIPVIPAAKPSGAVTAQQKQLAAESMVYGGESREARAASTASRMSGDGVRAHTTSLERTLKVNLKGTDSDCPFMKGMLDEINQFQQEMSHLKQQAESTRVDGGSGERNIAERVASLTAFCKEIVQNTEHNNREITDLKSAYLDLYATVEDCRLRMEHKRDKRYTRLLKQRSLDPVSSRKMQQIHSLYHGVNASISDVNMMLDHQWNIIQQQRKQKKKLLQGPQVDLIYRTLSCNTSLIGEQKAQIDRLTKKLMDLNFFDTKLEADDKENIFDSAVVDQSESPFGQPLAHHISPAKQNQLRQVLSRRKVTPLKTSAPANLSMSKIVSADAVRQSFLESHDNYDSETEEHVSMINRSGSYPQPAPPQHSTPANKVSPFATNKTNVDKYTPLVEGLSPSPEKLDSRSMPKSLFTSGGNAAAIAKNNVKFAPAPATTYSAFSVPPNAPLNSKTFVGTSHTISPNAASSDSKASLPFSGSGQKLGTISMPSTATSQNVGLVLGGSVVRAHDYADIDDDASDEDHANDARTAVPTSILGSILSAPVKDKTPIKASGISQTVPDTGNIFGQNSRPSGLFGSSTPSGFAFGKSATSGLGGFGSTTNVPASNVVFGQAKSPISGISPAIDSAVASSKPAIVGGVLSGQSLTQTSPTVSQTATGPDQTTITTSFGSSSSVKTSTVFGQRKSPVVSFGQSYDREVQPSNTSPSSALSFGSLKEPSPTLSSTSVSAKNAEEGNFPAVADSDEAQGTPFLAGKTQTSAGQSTLPASIVTSGVAAKNHFGSLVPGQITTSGSSVSTSLFGQKSPVDSSGQAAPKVVSSFGGGFLQSSGVAIAQVASATTMPSGGLFGQTSPQLPLSTASSGGLFGKPIASTTVGNGSHLGQAPTSGGIFGQGSTANTFAASNVFGQSAATSSSSGGLFGQAAATGTFAADSIFGKSAATTTSAGGGLFGQPAAVTTTPSSGVFGQSSATAAVGGGDFGQAVTTSTISTSGVFGQAATTTTATSSIIFGQPAASGGLFGQATSTASSASSGPFGKLTGNVPSGGLFGQSTNSTSVTSGGLFGQTTSSGFGQSSASESTPSGGLFGKSLPASFGTGGFGQTSSVGGLFGQTAASGTTGQVASTSPFGQSAFGKMSNPADGSGPTLFGQTSSSGFGKQSVFGQSPAAPVSSSFGSTPVFASGAPAVQTGTSLFASAPASPESSGAVSFGGFGGLGGKADPIKAAQNVFGGGTFVGVTPNTGNLFGGVSSSFGSPSTFGAPTSAATSAGVSSPFGGGTSATSTGFGALSTPTKPGGFSASPAFGGAPTFGSAPAFGATPTFGSTPSFGASAAASGQSPSRVFGSSSPAAGSGFAQLAQSSNPTFGALAQSSSPGFGQQQASSPAPVFGGATFGSGAATFGGGFGSANSTPQAKNSFMSYR